MACIVLARPHAHQVQTIGHLPVRWCCTGDVQHTGTPECPAGHMASGPVVVNKVQYAASCAPQRGGDDQLKKIGIDGDLN